MAKPVVLQNSYALGMRRDMSRSDLPNGAVWNAVDYFPDYKGPMQKRGGWSWAGPTVSGTHYGVAYAPFASGAQLLQLTADGVTKVTSSSTSSNVITGAAWVPYQAVFHREKMVITASGAHGRTWDGASAATLSSDPQALYAAVYKDRTFLANATGNTNRVWYSSAGDPTTYDTSGTGLWFDTTGAVVGLAALSNSVIVYHGGTTERLTGSPGVDLYLAGLADVGCADFRSIVTYRDTAIWADTKGVWLSDGTAPVDLTDRGQMKTYWIELLSNNTWDKIAATVIRGLYIVTVSNSNAHVDTLVCDVARRRWWRLSNFPFTYYAHVGSQASDEAYALNTAATRLVSLSSIFSPSDTTKADADTTAIKPVWETPFYDFDVPSEKSWKALYANLDFEAASATDMKVEYVTSLGSGASYTTLSAAAFATGTKLKRERISIGLPSRGLAFRFTQNAVSSTTIWYEVEADVHAREGSRLAQS